MTNNQQNNEETFENMASSYRCCDNGDLDEKHNCLKKPQNSDWREEFDKEFYTDYGSGIRNSNLCHDKYECDDASDEEDIKRLKDFISSTIQSEVDKAVRERGNELVEKIEGLSKEAKNVEELEQLPINEETIKELVSRACDGRQNAVIKEIINLIITSPTRATMGNNKDI